MEDVVETVVHEEVVRTRTEVVPVRRARLQRVVVRERRTIEIEVAHEEVRVVVDELDAAAGADIDVDAQVGPPSRDAVSTVLHEERIELVRRVVPVERVVLRVVPVAGEARVPVAVAREAVELVREDAARA